MGSCVLEWVSGVQLEKNTVDDILFVRTYQFPHCVEIDGTPLAG